MNIALAEKPATLHPVPLGSQRRDKWTELGLGLVVIAVPIAFLPSTSAPFLDVKFVLLVAGALAIWAGRRKRHLLALPAATWILIGGLAALQGVDPWQSITGSERNGNGLLLFSVSCFFLVAATATPASIHRRVPKWLVGTSVACAVIALADRFIPGPIPGLGGLSLAGGTIGHPVFLSILAAAGIAATVGLERTRPGALIAILVVLTSAMALSTKRAGWVAVAVGLGVALLRTRPSRRRALLIVSVVAATSIGWTLVDTALGSKEPLTGARRFSELATGSARTRVTAASALTRAWTDRPLLGWGPGNTWPAYLSTVTERELEHAERGVNDAHNILLEAAATTGALGLSALVLLIGLTVRAIRHGPRSSGWAAGGAAALFMGHLLQPVNVSLTPLMFLLAGLACGPDERDARSGDPTGSWRRLRGRAVRLGAGLALSAALTLSLALFAASAFERHGRTYASERALRASHAVAPWRVSAARALALHLALDGYTGDRQAADEAARLAEQMVRRHPWHPIVRLTAADVHLVVRDRPGATRWIERHLEVFPADRLLFPDGWDGEHRSGRGR